MEFSIRIEPDENGYIGRECPACEKYFKIKFGTGLPDATDCHCPYCNFIDSQSVFHTKQQIEYAQSVVLNEFSNNLINQLKKFEKTPDKNAFISIGISVEGEPIPIVSYSETELEEYITCSNCTLDYTIYGVFGYCPDCGIHNSLQILNANYDLILKILDLSLNADPAIKAKLIENSLEDTISAFDGFGREYCSSIPKISFQNIVAAKDKLLRELGFDISTKIEANQWQFICEQFQKRHLIAHKMGVIDEDFVVKTGCSSSLIGRKVSVTEVEVRNLIEALKHIAIILVNSVEHD